MVAILTTICAVVVLIILLVRRRRDKLEMQLHSITPEDLHALLDSHQEVLVVDVRHPLDFVSDSVIIPGAKWFAPQEVLENSALIPKDNDLIVYCTCPNDKTSRAVLRRALAKGFARIKFLVGGLDSWRAKGFLVEPFKGLSILTPRRTAS
jgi:rhodanese-related sulfurtransferase